MSAVSQIRAFPWASLESTTRAEVAVTSAARRWAERHLRLDAFGDALGEVVGAPVQLQLRRVQRLEAARPFGTGFAWAMESADSASLDCEVLTQVETALGAVIGARVLRRPQTPVVDDGASSSALAGALAAIFMAAARRAHRYSPMRVTATGTVVALEAERARPVSAWTAVDLTLILADDAFAVRVLVPHQRIASTAPAEWTRRSLDALGKIPLGLSLVACVMTSTAGDIASLRPGDALVPPLWGLARASATARCSWTGPVSLAAATATVGVTADLTEDRGLVLRGDLEALDGSEANMGDDSAENKPLVDSLGDVPVLVRVEIGEVTMAAREWAALGRGDVIALGRRVGERVLLRVGGVPLARGDLVDIDGEVGVRVVERIDDTRVT